MKYWLNGQECRPNDYGYIFQGTKGKNMYLCQLYIEAELSPNSINCCDSKAGILIHEVSHQAAQTEDHFYSYKNCTEEAFTCNPQTTTNADVSNSLQKSSRCRKIYTPMMSCNHIFPV